MIKVNKIFSGYGKIDNDKYELIKFISNREFGMYSPTSSFNMGKNFLYKRSLELINTINNYNSDINKNIDTTIVNNNHRRKIKFEKEIEKQIFINNFLFYDDEQFINNLKSNNINLNDIENLVNTITNYKKEAKETKNYELDISNIFNIDSLSNYYNFNLQEVIINKIFELYYRNYEALKELETKKR